MGINNSGIGGAAETWPGMRPIHMARVSSTKKLFRLMRALGVIDTRELVEALMLINQDYRREIFLKNST